ncbi:MAG: stage II sporulation protein E (SpoIIE), partial [Deltaproteobacteria bacterium]
RDPMPTHEALLLRGGVLGYQLPSLRVSALPVTEGDLLAFATDGIRGNFSEGLSPDDSPQQNTDRILACFCKETDDALVLVLRFRGKD